MFLRAECCVQVFTGTVSGSHVRNQDLKDLELSVAYSPFDLKVSFQGARSDLACHVEEDGPSTRLLYWSASHKGGCQSFRFHLNQSYRYR